MSTLNVDKVDPSTGTALELGTSGDTITVPTGAGLTVVDEVKTNKISPATGTAFALGDSGDTFTVPSGATIVNSGTATGFGGASTLLSTQTASDSSSIEFTSDIDATYKLYMIDILDYNPVSDSVLYSREYRSGWVTSSYYRYATLEKQSDDGNSDGYSGSGTDAIHLHANTMDEDDGYAACFRMFFANPSSAVTRTMFWWTGTYVTNSSSVLSTVAGSGYYYWVPNAITGVNFFPSTGNIESGTFKLYGIT